MLGSVNRSSVAWKLAALGSSPEVFLLEFSEIVAPMAANTRISCGEVLEHTVHDRGRGIDDIGDTFELFCDRTSHDGGEEVTYAGISGHQS